MYLYFNQKGPPPNQTTIFYMRFNEYFARAESKYFWLLIFGGKNKNVFNFGLTQINCFFSLVFFFFISVSKKTVQKATVFPVTLVCSYPKWCGI